MEFPTIHTNIWDAVLAIPVVMILTELIKLFTTVPRFYLPTVAVIFGLAISIFYSHPGNLVAGIFMGFFYGYAAIGSYSSLKVTIETLRAKKEHKKSFD
ncbi:hypothetical protein [Pseudalkalibacillus caeni]|uniref:Holin n=1 Tax=Exobacillus caeni TaxID=2574798 RepID=A0A5R9F8A5_9BACL|nr:hypothetical protein [Pseudalkalibacillus caeni]TLS36744.1 hypothetical protein FCL54_12325 [Pseudalkalibacillus caeni]